MRPVRGAGFARAPNLLEHRFVELAQVQANFFGGDRDLTTVLRRVHREMIGDLLGRVRKEQIKPRTIGAQRRSKFRGEKKAIEGVLAVATAVGRHGIDDVAGELERMESAAGSRPVVASRGALALEAAVEAFEDEARLVATQTVGSLWERLLGEALDQWELLNRQYPPGHPERSTAIPAALEAFLEGLSDKPIEKLGRQASTVVYNEGRRAEIESAAVRGDALFVVRSEVLDENTCEVCEVMAKDPPVLEIGSPEYYQFFPPALCIGGKYCRGFYIAVSESLLGASQRSFALAVAA